MDNDLISRKKLLGIIDWMLDGPVVKLSKIDEINRAYLHFREIVSDERLFPFVEAAPVRYGAWLPAYEQGKFLHDKIFRCSRCWQITLRKSKYCPNCGAKMYTEKEG